MKTEPTYNSLEQRGNQFEAGLKFQTAEMMKLKERLKQETNRRKLLESELKDLTEDVNALIEESTSNLSAENERLRIELDERIMMTDVLHENEQQFRALVASIPGAVYRIRIDNEWTVEFISDGIEDISGYPASKFRWHPIQVYRNIIHEDDRDRVALAIRDAVEPLKSLSVEYRVIDAYGNMRWFLESGQAVFGPEGAPLWFDGTIYDDSDRKFAEEALHKANEELKRLASVDGLTQIANRRRFDEIMEKEWERMIREKGALSLIMCDIDFFKLFNDNYGHQEGDRCLQAVAKAIDSALMRPADLAARYGGEEFVVILPNTNEQGAMHLAERIRKGILSLKIPHAHSKTSPYLSLSLGISSIIPEKGVLSETLIKAADMALYEAKEKGRNRAVLNTL